MKAVTPTKGNLIATKKTLALAKVGYELMDKKRNILVKEMMSMIDDAKSLQQEIDKNFKEAYSALCLANITTGDIQSIAKGVPIDNGIIILTKSIMGVEIPTVKLGNQNLKPYYGMESTTELLDNAYIHFNKVKELCAKMAQIENSIYRLALTIKKSQKRTNALKNVVIPENEAAIKYISEALEEKDTEEFIRLKVIKKQHHTGV